MTKQEFMQALGEKLSEGLPADEVLRQMQYYEGYLDAETSRGRSEASVLSELGDPVLLARNVLESPTARAAYWNTQSPYEQGFAEGSYESKNRGVKSANTGPASSAGESAPVRREAPANEKKPDGVWRKAAEPEELKQRGSWRKAPEPEEKKEEAHRGRVQNEERPGILKIIMPLILAIVLVTAFIISIVTGAVALKDLLLPLILLAAALVVVVILVIIRRKK